MYHSERFVLIPAHDYASPVQHLGDEYRAVPWELQLGSAVSSQRYALNPYKLSGLVLSPLSFAVVVMFLMQHRSLQPLAGVPVRCPQPPLECGHILAHCLLFLVWPQGCPVHGLNRESCLPAKHYHVWGHPRAGLRRSPVAHQDEWHELIPLLLRLPAHHFQAPAQHPETLFYEPIAPRVVQGSPRLVYSEQPTHLQHHL